MLRDKKDIISRLQKDILRLQGIKTADANSASSLGLGEIEQAFPNGIFPKGTIHEFLTFEPECKAATSGFISGLLNTLMQTGGVAIWISTYRTVFPLSLKSFCIQPDRVIFVDLKREKDVLWVAEEALKCEGLAAVITELSEMSFTQSRRLQLAVEKSKVTGFILRKDPLKLTSSACAARWQIAPLPSLVEDELPGVGFPKWQIELLKVRNGNPGIWEVAWNANQFMMVEQDKIEEKQPEISRKAG